MTIDIHHNMAENQFYLIQEGKKATLDYRTVLNEKKLEYYSTFVPVELRGQKMGESLVKFALDYAKKNHYQVIPSCPFVKHFIDKHPEYSQ